MNLAVPMRYLCILLFPPTDLSPFFLDYSILRVRATDADEGTNSEIVYEIESGATKDMFKIESNGDIKTKVSLDRELHGTHRLVVAAKDKGTPSLRGTTVVVITVLDENDNAPVFDQVQLAFN